MSHETRKPTALSLAVLLGLFSLLNLLPLSVPSAAAAAPASLRFDGANDIARTVNLPLSAQFTVEAWVRRSVDSGTYQSILSDANSSYGQAMFTLFVDGGNQDCGSGDQFAYYQSNGNSTQCSGVSADLNIWHHVAVSRDASGARRFFVDGVLRSTQTNTPAPTDSAGILTLGRAGDYNGEYFGGDIDEVRISNAALYTGNFTPPAAPLTSGPNTIALWHIDEGSGQTIADSSGNGRNGTLGSGAGADSADPVWTTASPIGGETATDTPTTVPSLTPSQTPAGTNTPSSTPTTGPSPTASSTSTPAPTPTLTLTPTLTPTPTPTRTQTATPIGTPGPAQIGQWQGPFNWPIAPVHMMVLRTGQVLMFDQRSGGTSARYWNPATNTFTSVPNTATNLFCAGHSQLADGRTLVIGGHLNENFYGLPDTNTYDPISHTWTRVANMRYPRWYPTSTTLPDGRVLAISGWINPSQLATVPEVYNPATNTWTALDNAARSDPMYSFMFVLPDGTVLNAGPAVTTRRLNVATQTWTTVGNSFITGHSAVMYQPGKVMKSGTLGDPDNPLPSVDARTVVIDMNQPAPAWREVASMAFPRAYHNLVLLPDGSVLAAGGERTAIGQTVSQAVYETELWNPQTETWTTMARLSRPRLYHSTALLLPDGRVLMAGGDFEPYYEPNAEIYSPPYLFKGPRPAISAAPTAVPYDTDFFVETADAARIASISLIRLPAVTHGFDQDQRFMNLTFQPSANGLLARSPANANLAPPGYYMLFILDDNGVPSVASILQVSSTATPPPTPTYTPTPTPTPTPTLTLTPTPTLTLTPTPTPPAGNFSLRFFGNGAGDIDRVKIQIDDPANANPGPPADVGAEDFTLEFWMKASAADNTAPAVTCGANHNWITGNIVVDRDRFNQDRKFGLSIAGGRLVFGVTGAGTGELTICGNGDVLDGQWHHVAVERRRADGWLWLYVDGVLQAQGDGPDGDVSYPDDGVPGNFCNGPCLNSDPFLVIGAEKHDSGPEYPSYSGWIDEVRLSNSLRYASNFTRPTQPFGPDASTVALYHFDEGSGDAINDTSNVPGGPSHGVRRFGGAPPGPEWSTDTPFGGSPQPTVTPSLTPTRTPTLTLTPSLTPTPTPPTDLIFADGFESGSLNAWSAATTDSGDLSATTAAALSGSFGLRALIDSNGAIFTTDDSPAAEPRYRARFAFDLNAITMSGGNAFYLFYGYTGSSTPVLRVEFRRSTGGNYQLRAAARNDASTWTNSAWLTLSDAPHTVEFDWQAATAAGVNDGGLTFWLDGVQRANLAGLDNDTRRIDRARLGAVAGIDSGTRGTIFFDAFESRRLTYIGPISN